MAIASSAIELRFRLLRGESYGAKAWADDSSAGSSFRRERASPTERKRSQQRDIVGCLGRTSEAADISLPRAGRLNHFPAARSPHQKRHAMLTGLFILVGSLAISLYIARCLIARPRERKQRAERCFRSLMACSAGVITLVDADGIIRYQSDSLQSLVGRDPSSLVGRKVTDLFVADDSARILGAVTTMVLDHRTRSTVECRLRHGDGGRDCEVVLHNLLDELSVSGIVLSIQDVSERKQIEKGRFQLNAIVESSKDAIISSTLDGIITSWNSGAQELYGYAPAEVIGRSMSLLSSHDRSEEAPEIIEKAIRGQTQDIETVHRAKNGSPVEVSLVTSPIRDLAGVVVGASSIARDVSERKSREFQLRQSQKL